jgi:hypothetical protein
MTDGDTPEGDTADEPRSAEPTTDSGEPGAMRTRTWSVAVNFHEPADYDIPPLPEWTVYKETGGGMALGAEEGDGVFIAADEPMAVRR